MRGNDHPPRRRPECARDRGCRAPGVRRRRGRERGGLGERGHRQVRSACGPDRRGRGGQGGLRRVLPDDRPDQEGGCSFLGDRGLAAVRVRGRARRVDRSRGAERGRAGNHPWRGLRYHRVLLRHVAAGARHGSGGHRRRGAVRDRRPQEAHRLLDALLPVGPALLRPRGLAVPDDRRPEQAGRPLRLRNRNRAARAGPEVRSEGDGQRHVNLATGSCSTTSSPTTEPTPQCPKRRR